jgi:phospholipid/cholesterol/gamma-HCH transport system permease protein
MTAVERVGGFTLHSAAETGALTLQLWRALLSVPRILPVVGNRRRWSAAVRQMLVIGVQALPMAGLMSLCLGYVLALQCAAELRRFDAMRFVVDLVAVSFTRELGGLITAIAVSGRSASAIAAEVGTMVVTEEIDALRVMGLDPVEFTLTPKYLGALITVPCLTVLSTFCGVFAGYLFLAFSVDMNIRVYFHAVIEAILLRDVWLTLIKSVIFATIIVQVGYLEGLRARGGPEAVGGAATAAVVKATFLVILADLAATAVFYVMGWSAAG